MITNTIRRRFVSSLLVAVATLALVSGASAQIRIPESAVGNATGLEQVVQQGVALEQQQRWGEALIHWEQALREFPATTDLRQRLTFAKINYDLDRRYADSSFLSSLNRLSEQKTLDLYSEVLLQVLLAKYYLH